MKTTNNLDPNDFFSNGIKASQESFQGLFPALKDGVDIQNFVNMNPEDLKEKLPQFISKLPMKLTSYDETLNKMQKLRGVQEKKIHDSIQCHRPINFIDEVSRYNPEIKKALDESENPQKALSRIITESNDRIDNFKRSYQHYYYHDEDESEADTIIKEEKENEEATKEFSDADNSLSFLDLRENKSSSFTNQNINNPNRSNQAILHNTLNQQHHHNNNVNQVQNHLSNHSHNNHQQHGQQQQPLQNNNVNDDAYGVGFDHDDGLPATPGKNTNKIVLYSSSKRYVFGFDKVENLLEPDIDAGDDLMLDNDRDILKEINSNFDQNAANAYKFLNFGQDNFTHNSDDQTDNSLHKASF